MPIIPPTWTKNAAKNISCWLCEHFQRYQFEAPPNELMCEGECRKHPPRNQKALYLDDGALIGDETPYPFWVQISQFAWCSGFQRTLEKNLPDPPSYPDDCHLGPLILDAITPPVYQRQDTPNKPYSKRPVSESCWACKHFQRLHEDLESPIGTACLGYCQIEPQDSYVDQQNTGPAPGAEEYQTGFARIWWSTSMWCSRWERSLLPIPDEPDYGQGPCYWNPV
jgi:hypothetical protein